MPNRFRIENAQSQRIKELCVRLAAAQSGPEFERLAVELDKAIDTYSDIQKANGDKAVDAN